MHAKRDLYKLIKLYFFFYIVEKCFLGRGCPGLDLPDDLGDILPPWISPLTHTILVFLLSLGCFFSLFSFHLRAAAALAGVVPKAVSLSWSARVQVFGEEGGGWPGCVRRYAKGGLDKEGVGRVKSLVFVAAD